MKKPGTSTLTTWIVHAGSWLPLILLAAGLISGRFNANPIQAVEQKTGQFAITWLLLSLACTPAARIFQFRPAIKARRPLGLYAFFYAALHLLTFSILDYGLDLKLIATTFLDKPFIIAGTLAFTILLLLAATSPAAVIRKLKQRWKPLHRLVYLGGILAAVHYLWAVKLDYRKPVVYAAILLILLVLRIPVIQQALARAFHPNPRPEP